MLFQDRYSNVLEMISFLGADSVAAKPTVACSLSEYIEQILNSVHRVKE
jgi:hypothetical protein